MWSTMGLVVSSCQLSARMTPTSRILPHHQWRTLRQVPTPPSSRAPGDEQDKIMSTVASDLVDWSASHVDGYPQQQH